MDNGLWRHKERYTCGAENAMYANVLIGHSADIITLDINGTGCNAAKDGWEQALYGFINAVGGHITRCDVARDFFEEEYTPEKLIKTGTMVYIPARVFAPKGNALVQSGLMMIIAARLLLWVCEEVQSMPESMTRPNNWVTLRTFGYALRLNTAVVMVG